jgi:hypothetical protein
VNGIDATGIKQDAFRQRRLATVNVSTNANVAQCMVVVTATATHPSFIVAVVVELGEESVEKNSSAGASEMMALDYSFRSNNSAALFAVGSSSQLATVLLYIE